MGWTLEAKKPETFAHIRFIVEMMKDTLFLLTAGFEDRAGAPYYCPHCAIFEGLLHLYPFLSSEIDVVRVGFARPRPQIVALLGEEYQSCPVIVLGAPFKGDTELLKTVGGRQFIDDPHEIGTYLSLVYGIPRPH